MRADLIDFLCPISLTPQRRAASMVFCVTLSVVQATGIAFGIAYAVGAGLRLGLGL